MVREHHWLPEKIGSLFFDSIDYNGMMFWYEDIVAVNKELESKAPKK